MIVPLAMCSRETPQGPVARMGGLARTPPVSVSQQNGCNYVNCVNISVANTYINSCGVPQPEFSPKWNCERSLSKSIWLSGKL